MREFYEYSKHQKFSDRDVDLAVLFPTSECVKFYRGKTTNSNGFFTTHEDFVVVRIHEIF